MAISSELRARFRPLNSFPVEFHGRASSVNFQRSACADGVGADEDPVLPGGQATEDARLQSFPRTKSQVCFKPCQGIRRLRRTRLDGLADFVFPIEIIGRGGNQPGGKRLARRKPFSNCLAHTVYLRLIVVKACRQPRKFVHHRQRAKVHFRECHARDTPRFLRIAHVDAVGGKRQLEKRADKAGPRLDNCIDRTGGDINASKCPPHHSQHFANKPIALILQNKLVGVEDGLGVSSGFENPQAQFQFAGAQTLDDAILSLRASELELGLWIFKTAGNPEAVLNTDKFILENQGNWFVREVLGMMRRTFARIDVTSRSIYAIVEPGSCFVGTFLELALAADRIYMRDTQEAGSIASMTLSKMNFGPLPMVNKLSRLAARFYDDETQINRVREAIGKGLSAREALAAGLVTAAPDDLDWEDEIRQAIESRAAQSPDALTGLEANLRFGPGETLETRIFGRLSAWQNW